MPLLYSLSFVILTLVRYLFAIKEDANVYMAAALPLVIATPSNNINLSLKPVKIFF
jgi:hypothetical protein